MVRRVKLGAGYVDILEPGDLTSWSGAPDAEPLVDQVDREPLFDEARPGRGLAIGCLVSAAFWIVLALVVWILVL